MIHTICMIDKDIEMNGTMQWIKALEVTNCRRCWIEVGPFTKRCKFKGVDKSSDYKTRKGVPIRYVD